MDQQKIYKAEWRGIPLAITHTPNKWNVIEHILVESETGEAFPGAANGIDRHYLCADDLAEYENAADFVLQCLDFLAEENSWTGQLSLF